jgi:hypothetical protein
MTSPVWIGHSFVPSRTFSLVATKLSLRGLPRPLLTSTSTREYLAVTPQATTLFGRARSREGKTSKRAFAFSPTGTRRLVIAACPATGT